jgi:crossover junction endodeoxyribonuclease RusA
MTAWTLKDIEGKGLRVLDTARVMQADCVTLSLPLPPSVNSAWSNIPGKGRVRSAEYRRWHKQAFDELTLQKPGHIPGRFAAVINAGRIKRRADVDNRIKPLLDLLSGTVTDDDALCERVSAGWDDTIPAERVVVVVRRAA